MPRLFPIMSPTGISVRQMGDIFQSARFRPGGGITLSLAKAVEANYIWGTNPSTASNRSSRLSARERGDGMQAPPAPAERKKPNSPARPEVSFRGAALRRRTPSSLRRIGPIQPKSGPVETTGQSGWYRGSPSPLAKGIFISFRPNPFSPIPKGHSDAVPLWKGERG
jgi:hypothetical protein